MDLHDATNAIEQHINALLLGNSPLAWLIAAGVLVAAICALIAVKWITINRLEAFSKRTSFVVDDALVCTLRATQIWLLLFPALAFAAGWLTLPDTLMRTFKVLATLAFFIQAGIWLNAATGFLIERSRQNAIKTNMAAATSLSAIAFISKLLIWSITLLLALDNVGIDVTALVAGLGVGGVAVALAVQNILGDLFASMSIVVDKPFEIGDFIIVGDFMGSVEHIGLKTTRLRSLSGEQIIFSNSDLLSSRTRNYKRMFERRVVFGFGLLYQSTPEQLEKVPPIVKKIITEIADTRFDRAHFFKFGDSSLDFEVVYWVLSPDFNLYMDIQQDINLKLMRALAAEGLGFAYPSRSLYVETPVPVRVTSEPQKQTDAPHVSGPAAAH
jgi:small-conductance mechanosensitive channel